MAALPGGVGLGYARLRALVETDGALPSATKALMVAVAATVRGEGPLADRELSRALAEGLAPETARLAAAALLLARGEGASGRFLDALSRAGLDEPVEPAAPGATAAAMPDADVYFREYFGGEIPMRVALMAERAPGLFEAYAAMHHGVLRADPSSAKLAELILCAVNAADLQPTFAKIHADAARRVGAREDELLEALVCAVPVAGFAAWPGAAEVIAAGG